MSDDRSPRPSVSSEPPHGQRPRDESIGRLFLQAQRAYFKRGIAKLRARGHDRVTLAHTTLLPYLDPKGTSVTNLAERAGMTKQSMRQLVLDLEDKGYIKRIPDPNDGRATLVIFTVKGKHLIEDGNEVKKEIEDEYRALLGDRRLEALKGSLKTLIEKTSEDGALA
jgi:DNA-binding MarR family transcriptional regulator